MQWNRVYSCKQIPIHVSDQSISSSFILQLKRSTFELPRGWCGVGLDFFGLNIFYFKRNRITNKHKAYEWFSTSLLDITNIIV